MSRQPTKALGKIPTPHGPVLVRVQRHHRTGREGFVLLGPSLALQWMLPERSIASTASRTFVLPPTTNTTPLPILFEHFRAAWARRLASPKVATSASRSSSSTTVGDLIEEARSELATAVRRSTAATYEHEWAALLRFLPASTRVASITPTTLQDIARRAAEKYSERTVHKLVVHLRSLLKRAVGDGVITKNPAGRFRLVRPAEREPVFLTMKQRDSLLVTSEKRGRDVHLLVACGVFLGLRKAELCALRWSDVELDKRVVHVRNSEHFTTKSGRNRTIPICDALLPILTRYSRPRGFVLKPGNDYVDGSRYRWDFRGLFSSVVAEAGLDAALITPHVMRHTFASLSAQAGTPLHKIAEWMGHSTLNVTELYAHLDGYDPDINRMAPAAEGAS